jgi:hypothetical protein
MKGITMTAITQLTAELNELNTALGVVEAQTIDKGFMLRKDEETLYMHLITNLDSKQLELDQLQQNKRTIKSFIPHFNKK